MKQIFQSTLKSLLPAPLKHRPIQVESRLADHLLIEEMIMHEDRPIMILGDGAVGCGWAIEALAHEIMDENNLKEKLTQCGQIFDLIQGERIVWQILFDQKFTNELTFPNWFKEKDRSFARRVMDKRIEAISGHGPKTALPLIHRRVQVYLRIESSSSRRALKGPLDDLLPYLEREAEILGEDLRYLDNVAKSFESACQSRLSQKPQALSIQEILALFRETFHEKGTQNQDFFSGKTAALGPLRHQVLAGEMNWGNDFIGTVGGGRWQALSWAQVPAFFFPGMVTRLLQLRSRLRAVMTIRPRHLASDLETLANKLKGGDPYGERQKRDVFATEDRIVGGERLTQVSWQLLIHERQGDCDHQAAQIARELQDTVSLYCETHNAFTVFISALPFHFSSQVAGFLARSRRVLSGDLGFLLPILGSPKGNLLGKGQLMQSRAGECMWLSARTSRTNPHVAIYGASQSGKSFYLANLISAEFATNPQTMVFLIDSLTSYEYLGRAVGEDHGFQHQRPPETFPNLFRGNINSDRVMIILGIFEVAVGLVAKADLSAAEKTLLGDAIQKTYDDNLATARETYRASTVKGQIGKFTTGEGRIQLPRLSEIVHKFPWVAERHDLSESIVQTLREKLLPFFGTGAYAKIFDQIEFEMVDTETPGLCLYDLAEISTSPELSTITTLIIIAEIERTIFHPANLSRQGMLVIEEAGVNLGGENPHLERYVSEAFARFAKRGISCITVTNRIEHYLKLPACKAAWSTAATTIILPILSEEERTQLAGLLKSEHLAELAKSLQKVPGQSSQFLWLGDDIEASGSFTPTGFDYWLSANHALDVHALQLAFEACGSWQQAIFRLASIAPLGFRDSSGALRPLNEIEIQKLRSVPCDKS